MIKTYRYNADKNTVSHILQAQGGVTVRYNFERGNIVTKRKPELILQNKYAQDLLEQSYLFKSGTVSLVRSEATSDDEIEEETTPTHTDTIEEPSKIIRDVTSEDEVLEFVNTNFGKKYILPAKALIYAQEQGYSFPNLKVG